MENEPRMCPSCGNDMKHILAGVSKRTGKPYNEFYVCSDKACGHIFNPPREPNEFKTHNQPPVFEDLLTLKEFLDKISILRGDMKKIYDQNNLVIKEVQDLVKALVGKVI